MSSRRNLVFGAAFGSNNLPLGSATITNLMMQLKVDMHICICRVRALYIISFYRPRKPYSNMNRIFPKEQGQNQLELTLHGLQRRHMGCQYCSDIEENLPITYFLQFSITQKVNLSCFTQHHKMFSDKLSFICIGPSFLLRISLHLPSLWCEDHY